MAWLSDAWRKHLCISATGKWLHHAQLPTRAL